MSYFTNIAVQNVKKGFVYITDLTWSLKFFASFVFDECYVYQFSGDVHIYGDVCVDYNSELKQVTFLTTRTSTGSKVDVFHQSQPLTQSSDVTHMTSGEQLV